MPESNVATRSEIEAALATLQAERDEAEKRVHILDSALAAGVLVRLDGDQWCAHWPEFLNLQESPAAFGPTIVDAVAALIEIGKSA